MNAVILSCTTLLDYVQIAQKTCKTNFPVIELDRQYHVEPSKMRKHILHTLAGLSPSVDTVLVAMGLLRRILAGCILLQNAGDSSSCRLCCSYIDYT